MVIDTECAGMAGPIVEIAVVAADGTVLLESLLNPTSSIAASATTPASPRARDGGCRSPVFRAACAARKSERPAGYSPPQVQRRDLVVAEVLPPERKSARSTAAVNDCPTPPSASQRRRLHPRRSPVAANNSWWGAHG